MRFARYVTLATFVGATFAPVSAPAAANKDMEELQRDVADLSDQVKTIQKTLDSKVAALQTLVQQALDTANKTNTSVSNLNIGMMQTMQTALKGLSDQLNGVTNLSVKVENTSNDVADLHSAVASLVVTVNKEQQQLNDILNQVKLLQAPPAPPPGADSAGAPAGASGPPPTGQTLFNNAFRDQSSGKLEIAVSEYSEFLRLYPDDPNAIKARYNIGDIYYGEGKATDAVKAFNDATEQYPDDTVTLPGVYYMKGLALKKAKQPTAAIATFRDVIRKFPHSPEATQARAQLTELGASASAPARGKK
jgi:TolA-binding protein